MKTLPHIILEQTVNRAVQTIEHIQKVASEGTEKTAENTTNETEALSRPA